MPLPAGHMACLVRRANAHQQLWLFRQAMLSRLAANTPVRKWSLLSARSRYSTLQDRTCPPLLWCTCSSCRHTAFCRKHGEVRTRSIEWAGKQACWTMRYLCARTRPQPPLSVGPSYCTPATKERGRGGAAAISGGLASAPRLPRPDARAAPASSHAAHPGPSGGRRTLPGSPVAQLVSAEHAASPEGLAFQP